MVVGRMQPDVFDSLLVPNLESNNYAATNCSTEQLTLDVEAVYIHTVGGLDAQKIGVSGLRDC